MTDFTRARLCAVLILAGLVLAALAATALAEPDDGEEQPSGASSLVDALEGLPTPELDADVLAERLRAGGEPVEVAIILSDEPVAQLRADGVDAETQAAHREQLEARQARVAEQARAAAPSIRDVTPVSRLLDAVLARVDAAEVEALRELDEVERVAVAPPLELFVEEAATQVGAYEVHDPAGDFGVTGDGVTIAVLDTGLDWTHERLGGDGEEGHYTTEADMGDDEEPVHLDDNDRVLDVANFVGSWPDGDLPDADDPLPNAIDRNGHGTWVADTAAGSSPEGSENTYGDGVAPDASLLGAKVCNDNGACSFIAVVAGLEWAADTGADIANLSLGAPYVNGDPAIDPLAAAVEAAVADGMVVVAAAGNAGDNPYIVGTPGGAPGAITVAATTLGEPLSVASFSSRGPGAGVNLKPDLAAPGTVQPADVGSGDQQFGEVSGTSFAAPIVSGIAALQLQHDGSHSPADVKAAVMGTADPGIVGEEEEEPDVATAQDDDDVQPPSRVGLGEARAPAALGSDVLLVDAGNPGAGSQASFGHLDVTADQARERTVEVRNLSGSSRTVHLGIDSRRVPDGVQVSVSPGEVQLDAGASAEVTVTVDVSASALPPWRLQSAVPLGGDGHALTAAEVDVRLVATDGDEEVAAAGVHALPRSSADVSGDLPALLPGLDTRVRLINDGVADSTTAWFDLAAVGDGEAIDAIGALGPLGTDQCDDGVLLVATALADQTAHAATSEIIVTLDVDGDNRGGMLVTRTFNPANPDDPAGAVTVPFELVDGIPVLHQDAALPAFHPQGSANVVAPACAEAVGLGPTDGGGTLGIEVSATAPGLDAFLAVETLSGHTTFGVPRFVPNELASGVDAGATTLQAFPDRGGAASGVLGFPDEPRADGDQLHSPGLPAERQAIVLPAGDPPAMHRLSGPQRFATAIDISRDQFGSGQADTVVLARADDFADALAGAALAVDRDGPLLLSTGDGLFGETATEIDRVLAGDGEVILLGGTAALSDAVRDDVAARGHSVRRVAGSTRIGTAIQIAGELDHPDEVLIADGFNFPDALAAGAAAGARGSAVLLTTPEEPSGELDGYLAGRAVTAWAIGGPAARAYPDAQEIFGTTRFETAEQLARQLFDDPTTIGLARADDFPDALAGGAHAGRLGGPIVLTMPSELHPAPERIACDRAGRVADGYGYGGTAALADAVLDTAEARLRASGCDG